MQTPLAFYSFYLNILWLGLFVGYGISQLSAMSLLPICNFL